MNKYEAWIQEYVERTPFLRGQCDIATREMVAKFPELKRVGGFVYPPWGREQHWWCLAPDGTILDPTREQYPGWCDLGYEAIDLSNPEEAKRVPTGRCMDCGGDVYEHATFCNKTCEEKTRAYLGI